MHKRTKLYRALFATPLALFLSPFATPALGAPLSFPDTPPGTGFKPPKPNVIMSFDNSGSMAYDVEGCKTYEWFQAGYDGGLTGSNYKLDGDQLYINVNVRQSNCLYEEDSGSYNTADNAGGWYDFRTYSFGTGSYYKAKPGKSRIKTLKESLGQVMRDSSIIAEGSIRLAWQAMWNNGETVDAYRLTRGAANSMKIYKDDAASGFQHKSTFLSYLDSLTPKSGTPSHRLMMQAFNYMSNTTKDKNSPWAKDPSISEGDKTKDYLSCRRAYHIFLTDGAWNSQLKDYWNTNPRCTVYNSSGICQPVEAFPGFFPTEKMDTDSFALPDGTNSYDPSQAYARIFKGSDNGTLADWAFRSWATDLQPGIDNNIEPKPEYVNAPASSTIGSTTVPKFWDPKFDPATWQHLTTYSIGYSKSAYSWAAEPAFDRTWESAGSSVLANTYGGDFLKFYSSTPSITWPTLNVLTTNEDNRQSDLWHMALNGRGKFYPVDSGARLTAAFTEIFKTIGDDTKPGSTSTTASGSSNVHNDLGQFTAVFESTKAWKGYVTAATLDKDGNTSPKASWGTVGSPAQPMSTADKLDALTAAQINSRLILTTNDATNTGVSFAWNSDASLLSDAQKAFFTEGGAVTDTVAENRVNFIRGDRSNEDGTGYRKRQSRQGDIVNSTIWYAGKPASNFSYSGYRDFANSKSSRTPMIYVGGNDGMLHGFSADDGAEKIAYVPKGVMAALPSLTKPSYGHQFFVDGSPFAGDVDAGGAGSPDWRTLLVGTLGAGGRGYFVLNVTDPSNFIVGNAASLVVLDSTLKPRVDGVADPTGTDPDMGHIFSAPVPHEFYPMRASQIVRMNNGRWAVVLGNGYNSANEQPVLYIQYLTGDKSVKKLRAIKAGSTTDTTENKTSNGLSAPRLVDINGDDSPDVIYAGDLKGNLWKFDVSSSEDSEWDVAFSGAPLFTAYARSATGGVTAVRQPITAAPTVRPNPNGLGMMVAFGTGRNLTLADRSNKDAQSIYSVLDNTHYKKRTNPKLIEVHPGESCSGAPASCIKAPTPAVLTSSSKLISQSIGTTVMAGAGVSAGTDFWTGSKNPVNWSDTEVKGWYMNLPEPGERLLTPMNFYDGSNIMTVQSRVPASGSGDLLDETCTAQSLGSKQYLTLINIMNGWPASVPLMDKNGDKSYSTADGGAMRMSLLPDSANFTKAEDTTLVTSTGINEKGQIIKRKNLLNLMPIQAVRPSWRQLQ
ncbi:pilus assembly protein [Ottowia testudinis]|uniref:Pilus assembly protein PilC n=1 Tax=Ottowia testudinis TaxID=2816950 RepID=A0A975CE71_9BURK|nr:PilC/PilY family type IV pilus protein [Ottowia testudinis]QTD44765.1 pilus assembly protein PilC [Ottowia testudinis]